MITFALAALALCSPSQTATVDLIPTDDVWAYPHAEDQASDPYLRIWGAGGLSVAASAAESDSFGYSLLRFDLGGIAKDKTLKSATLVLIHVSKPAYTLDLAKAHPLEARPCPSGFFEKNWDYGSLEKYMPSAAKTSIFGSGVPAALDEEKEFPIKIDLLGGPGKFVDYFEAARKAGSLSFALTSALSPEDAEHAVYKVYSKDGPKEFRPVLKLGFE